MDFHASMAAMLDHWAHERPQAPALAIVGEEPVTFEGWRQRSAALANGLDLMGVAADEMIGFLGRSAVAWGQVWVAASMRGQAALPLNWRLSEAETTQVVEDATPSAVVVESEFGPLLGLDLDPAVELWIWRPGLAPVSLVEVTEGCAPERSRVAVDPEGISLVIYTSGTSGTPKGVQVSHRAIRAHAESTSLPYGIATGETVLVPAPMFHVSGSGWLFYCLAVGAFGRHLRAIVTEEVLDELGSGAVHHAVTVPAVVQMLVQHPSAPGRNYDALRTFIYGGSPISPTVATAATEMFGVDLIQSYGLTETFGPLTFLWPEDHRGPQRWLAAAGRPLADVDLRVVDPESGLDTPEGQTGEIWVRTAMLFSGYRNREGETRATFTDGWFRTGDAGHLEGGLLFLTDRVKDMIVSGGENVYPVEVENALMAHPAVRDVAVIGVPHERWGETVKAVVVLTPEAGEPDAVVADLLTHTRGLVAGYKCPTSVDVVRELPRNPSGKLLKRELRARYWQDQARSIG